MTENQKDMLECLAADPKRYILITFDDFVKRADIKYGPGWHPGNHLIPKLSTFRALFRLGKLECVVDKTEDFHGWKGPRTTRIYKLS